MKHYHLKKAIEKAKAAGVRVLRTFIPGVGLYVRVTNDKGDHVGKIYTAGNANAQASFIDGSIGKLKKPKSCMVDVGTVYRFERATLFISDTYKTIYAWNHLEKEWQALKNGGNKSLWVQDIIGAHYDVRVKSEKLCSGVMHPDW